MNDPLIARFASACGATGPLDLRVDLAGGGVLAEGSVDQPFTLIGRDDACDVTLSDPEINPRHAWLQVVGGRAFAVDLGSRTGLAWPGGVRGSGWLDVGTPVRIGPFLLRLRSSVADRPSTFPPKYDPLASDSNTKIRAPVTLEFRNGKRAKDRWTVNRLLTLVGRSPDCKIHLTADDISAYHCGLVSTRAGLWVIDLSGRGVVVNGERMRVAPLAHGTELWVGRFLIGCQCPAGTGTPTVGRHAALTAPVPLPAMTDLARPTEDEALLDAPDPVTGLPSSHIMADAFQPRGGSSLSGPPSHPIHVSGSEPSPLPVSASPAVPVAGLLADATPSAIDDESVVPLLRQLADLHARASGLLQHSLTILDQLLSLARREHLSVMQHELNRIQELDAEMAALQAEAVRQALAKAAEAAPDRARTGGNTGDRAKAKSPNADRPATAGANKVPSVNGEKDAGPPTAPHIRERLNAIAQERNARWQSLIALFTGV